MTQIKVCGLTRETDVEAAVKLGADLLGFIHVPKSARFLPLPRLKTLLALAPPAVKRVIVVQDADPKQLDRMVAELEFDFFQFHGHESPDLVQKYPGYKVIHVAGDHIDPQSLQAFPGLVLFDTQWGQQRGGSGRAFQWSVLQELNRPFMVAGGLNPENVTDLVQAYRPWAVDVSSGIEHAPGEKDHDAMAQFISKVRSAQAL